MDNSGMWSSLLLTLLAPDFKETFLLKNALFKYLAINILIITCFMVLKMKPFCGQSILETSH